jgi:hypothetical protein
MQPVGKPEITFFSHRLDPTIRESLLLPCGAVHVAHPLRNLAHAIGRGFSLASPAADRQYPRLCKLRYLDDHPTSDKAQRIAKAIAGNREFMRPTPSFAGRPRQAMEAITPVSSGAAGLVCPRKPGLHQCDVHPG